MNVILREDDVQGFDTKWDEVLSSTSEAPKDDILEGMCKQLKTTFGLYNQETVHMNEPTS